MAYSSLLNVERDASLLNDTPKNETIQFFVYKFDMCLYEKIMMNQARNYLLNWPFPGDSIFQFFLLMTHFLWIFHQTRELYNQYKAFSSA